MLVILVIQLEKIDAMKKLLICLFVLMGINFRINAQGVPLIEGSVSYVTPTSVYVRFENTKDLVAKDTLMIFINNQWKKALLVDIVSSKSCITKSFVSDNIMVGYKVAYYTKPEKPIEQKVEIVDKNNNSELQKNTISLSKVDSVNVKEKSTEIKQTYNGRLSVSANGSMNPAEKSFNRIRTTFTYGINNINGGKFSFENYIIYNHRFGVDKTLYKFNDDFKIFSLSMTYDINKSTSVALGRKINLRMANMGAIDGLQLEHKFNKFIVGGFGGFRPDDMTYGFNASLMQFGGYIAHEKETPKGQNQTSIAFAEQKNNGKTDRRFAYLQHSSSILQNLYLFYSLELDLFQNIDSVKSNKANLTSTYISLRYKPFKKLSITTSYDNRRNIIYYETYRTYLEQLLNQETRQGFRLNMNYNMSNFVNFNASGFYRYQSSRPEPTKNYIANLTFNQIPKLNASLSLSANLMKTYYFNGTIYGARVNKELFKNKVSAEFNYQKVDYNFFNTEQASLKQNIFGVSANIYGKKRTTLMLMYEGTFEPNNSYNRYYITLSQRFRSKNK